MLAYRVVGDQLCGDHRVRNHLSCLASLALAFALPAQSTVVTPWPGVAFETAISGTFLGGMRQCALVVRSGQLYLVFEPARFRGFSSISALQVLSGGGTSPLTLTGVTGLVGYRPNGLADNAGDVLLIATSTGVWRGAFAPDGGQSKLFCAAVLDPTWNGARGLSASKLTTGQIEVAARSAAGDRALIAMEESDGSITSVESRHSVNPINAVHLVDWDHDGDIDPLVVTTAGMGITAVDGELVLDCATNLASARTMPIKFVGNDQVGLIWNGPAYPQQSVVWGSRDCLQLARVDLPTSGFNAVGQLTTGAATFDVHADGTPEVLVSRVGDFRYLYVPSNGLVATITVVAGATGQPANNQCAFSWRDFDYDGQPDLLAFWNAGITDAQGSALKSMVFRSNMLPSPGSAQPSGHRQNFSVVGAILYAASYDGTKLYLQFRDDYRADDREVRVAVWRQPNPYVGTGWDPAYLSPEPYLDSQAVEQTISFGPTAENAWELAIGTTAGWNAGDHYYLDVRLVDTNSKEVLLAEVDAFRVFPAAAAAGYPGNSPQEFLDTMLKYLLERRNPPNAPYSSLASGTEPVPITISALMGGLPTSGIVLQIRGPQPNPNSTPVVTPPPPNGG